MYDNDAISIEVTQSGVGGVDILPTGTVRYIVGISMQQSGTASISQLLCGTTVIAKNYGKDFPFNHTMFRCADKIRFEKTGQDDSSLVMTYIARDLHSLRPVITEVNYATGSAIAMGNSMYLLWLAFGIIIMLQAIGIGTYIFKK